MKKKATPQSNSTNEQEVPTVPPHVHHGFRPKRKLTLEVRSVSKLGYAVFTCNGELQMSLMPSKFHPEGKAEAISVDVTDAVTDEQYTLVLNSISASALQRAGALLGRHFEITVGAEHEGKRYRDTEVTELEEGE
jgi:hypothetical protein